MENFPPRTRAALPPHFTYFGQTAQAEQVFADAKNIEFNFCPAAYADLGDSTLSRGQLIKHKPADLGALESAKYPDDLSVTEMNYSQFV